MSVSAKRCFMRMADATMVEASDGFYFHSRKRGLLAII